MPNQSKRLLDQVCDVLRLKHYSIRTEEAYVNWISSHSSLSRYPTVPQQNTHLDLNGGRAGYVVLQYPTSNALLLLGQCFRLALCLRRWFRARIHIILKLWVEVNTLSHQCRRSDANWPNRCRIRAAGSAAITSCCGIPAGAGLRFSP